jgi:hypothetical protein
VRVLLHDATNEPPDRGSIGDVITGEAALRLPRVEEANHATEAVEDKGARVSLGWERAGLLTVVVDGEFDGLDAAFVAKDDSRPA